MEVDLEDSDLVATIKTRLGGGGSPKFLHLAGILAEEIRSGNLPKGRKIPSYRVLSFELGLSAGTVQRAYRELERRALIVPRTGDGSYVLEPPQRANGKFSNAPTNNRSGVKDKPVIDLARNLFMLEEDLDKWASLHDMSDIGRDRLTGMLNYTDERGLPEHRAAGAEWMSHHKVEVPPEDIFCTNGSHQGIHLAIDAIMRMHDSIAVDEYTYPGVLSLARRKGIRIVAVERDANGLCPEGLDEKIRRNRISALFTTPTLQNPLGYRMPDDRRDEIAEICERSGVFIIEDEAQGILLGQPHRSFFDRLPGQTALVSGMSKAVSAGLRVGYLAVPAQLREQLRAAMKDACLMAPPLGHEMARRCIETGFAGESIQKNRLEVARRRKLVEPVLDGVEHVSADGSPHYWIALPGGVGDAEATARLARGNILVRPSSQFSSGHEQSSHFIRASVTADTGDESIRRAFGAIRKIAAGHRDGKAGYRRATFGPTRFRRSEPRGRQCPR